MFDATSIPSDESVERYSATAEIRREVRDAKLVVATSRLKRVFDIVVAGWALLLFLPLLLMVMAAIQIESPGPAPVNSYFVKFNGPHHTVA